MATDDTAGVVAAARLLVRLASAEPATVAEIASDLNVRRTTAFVVADALQAAGLAERDSRGRLTPGPLAGRLRFAPYGFGAITEAAEALLPALRDDTDASVFLVASSASGEHLLACRRAAWSAGDEAAQIETPIGRSAAGFVASLRLAVRPSAGQSEIRSARACAMRVTATLAATLERSNSA